VGPPAPVNARAIHRDERGIVVSFLVKVILGFAIVGTILIEGGSILFARLRIQDVAESAATAGAAALLQNPRVCAAAGQEALITAHDKDPAARMKSYECHPDLSFSVVMTKHADTLYVHLIGFLQPLTVATAHVTAQPPQPDV
jgi:hypothetical protein